MDRTCPRHVRITTLDWHKPTNKYRVIGNDFYVPNTRKPWIDTKFVVLAIFHPAERLTDAGCVMNE
jgi:hypothetical protein